MLCAKMTLLLHTKDFVRNPLMGYQAVLKQSARATYISILTKILVLTFTKHLSILLMPIGDGNI